MEKELKLKVTGMTCSACSAAIERITKKLEGVSESTVNLTTEKCLVTYDEDVVDIETIIGKINKAGYKAEIDIEYKEVVIPIEGMTCTACSAAIERVVKKLDGIEEVNVNYAANKGSFKYDTNKLRLSEIKNAIIKAGYKPLEIEKDDVNALEDRNAKSLKIMWAKFITAIIFTVPLLYITMGHMLGMPLPELIDPMFNPLTFAILQLCLTVPVMIAGYKFYTIGFRTLVSGHPNMDSLIAVGTSAAVIYSLFATYMISIGEKMYYMELYYETAAVIITLIMLGKTLEHRSKGKTSEAISKLLDLQPKTAIVLHGNEEVELPIEEVEVGDIILVKPGMSIPVDGFVTEGYSAVDESMISGESLPVEKTIKSKVIAASINKNGMLKVQTEKIGKDTALAKIINLVEHAQSTKAPIAKLADIISGYFVPTVIVIALITAIAWQIGLGDINFSLRIFISILVIACPCALGLATPTAIMVGTGRSAEMGILFKNGTALETAHKIQAIIFDKTGTITEGKPKVTDVITENISELELLSYVIPAEKASEHPLGEAIIKYGSDKNLEHRDVSKFESFPGYGLHCTINDKSVVIGNRKIMDKFDVLINDDNQSARLGSQGKTPMFIAIDNKYVGIIAVADTIKETSKEAIKELKAMGIKIAMITGDHKDTANAIGKEIGIDLVLSEVLPEDKAKEVIKLQEQGLIVAMVGDGINDAPALATANLGIAIGSGTDIAVESADIVLIKNDLKDVANTMKISGATIKNIKQNLFWAFFYNIVGIPVAAGVLHLFGGPLLNPMIAAAAMSMSSVSVVTNALRLKKMKL